MRTTPYPHFLHSDSSKQWGHAPRDFSEIQRQITENKVNRDKCSFHVSRTVKHILVVWFGIRVFGLPFSWKVCILWTSIWALQKLAKATAYSAGTGIYEHVSESQPHSVSVVSGEYSLVILPLFGYIFHSRQIADTPLTLIPASYSITLDMLLDWPQLWKSKQNA